MVCRAQKPPLGLGLALGLRHIQTRQALLGLGSLQGPKEIIPTTIQRPEMAPILLETVKTNDAMTGGYCSHRPESQTGNRFPFHSTETAANQHG